MDEHCSHTFRKILSTHKWQTKELVTYWLRCKSCGHKWKVYYDRSTQKEIKQTKEVMPPSRRMLTDLEVRLVLLDPRSAPAVAKDLGTTHQAIWYIRNGVCRADLWPDIPRQSNERLRGVRRTGAHGCQKCQHWHRGACSFDFPEAGMPGFAEECNYYTQTD